MTGPSPHEHGGWRRRLSRRPGRWSLLEVLVVGVLVVAAVTVGVGLLTGRGTQEPPGCLAAATVRVVVDPTLLPSVQRVVEEAAGTPLSTGVCADVELRAQDSARAAVDLLVEPEDGSPHLWLPDSSLWVDRAAQLAPADAPTLRDLGSFVSSPLVVATTPEVVAAAGWGDAAPTWAEVLGSGRDLALPDLATTAVGAQTFLTLRTTATDAAGRSTLSTAALAAERGRVADTRTALDLAAAAGADAALVPATEQQVFTAGRGSAVTRLVAVRPGDATAVLDHPITRLDTPEREAGVEAAAVEGVVRLLESQGREAALADGFRAPLRDRADADGVVAAVTPADLDALVEQLTALNRPSRVLALFDASASMRAVTASGATRADLARDAAKESFAVLPDSAWVGLWFFAVGMGGDASGASTDWVEVVPLQPLDPAAGGQEQRARLAAGADSLTGRLTPGGTGLYDAALAAVRAMREGHDPAASSTVLLVTDGRQEDPGGPGLEQVVATLQAEADPERPVRLVAVGLGGDVDAAELKALAAATGGEAYLAEQPADLPAVLLDALQRQG